MQLRLFFQALHIGTAFILIIGDLFFFRLVPNFEQIAKTLRKALCIDTASILMRIFLLAHCKNFKQLKVCPT